MLSSNQIQIVYTSHRSAKVVCSLYLQVEDAEIVYLDKMGMDIKVRQGEDTWRQRLPFIYPAVDRKKVKDVMVEMTKTAAIAMKKAAVENGEDSN